MCETENQTYRLRNFYRKSLYMSLIFTTLAGFFHCSKDPNKAESGLLLSLMDSASAVPTSSSFQLPDTNQSICYDTSGTVRSCAGTGEDGEYIDTPAPYNLTITDGGETVTETSSGLVWTRCEASQVWDGTNCLGTNYASVTWEYANSFCSQLTIAGRSWRLPSVREAILIFDYNITSGQTLPSTYFPNLPIGGGSFWTDTPVRHLQGEYVYAQDRGTIDWDVSISTAGIRCVSGPQIPFAEFADLGDGTISEQYSGLIIKKCAQGESDDLVCTGTPNNMTWQQALDSCETLDFAGKTNWRVPSVKEIYFLMSSIHTYGLPDSLFPGTVEKQILWTSTTFPNIPSNALTTSSIDEVPFTAKSTSSGIKVRCVAEN
ncbi:DUF1566 domain-containing protein [Leptospira sp. WS58.C1]|uniref:Lcl C-terminal domain-containing protein n=1 Tax=Leptospira cinconiae TaxID=3235173 RepID=UPI00349EF053